MTTRRATVVVALVAAAAVALVWWLRSAPPDAGPEDALRLTFPIYLPEIGTAHPRLR